MMQGTHDDVRRTLIMEQAKLVIVTNDRKIRGQKVLPSKEKVVNIDANKTPHASLQCAPSGVVLSGDGEKSQEDVIKPRFNKPALGVDDLADLLLCRGLKGISKSDLAQKLRFVNYYHLRGYTYPYQDNSQDDSPFIIGTTWQQIWADYQFDSELRMLIFDGISRFEIALRSIVTLFMCEYCGAQWFENQSLFVSEVQFQKDLKELIENWNRSKDDFKMHYVKCYDTNQLPPAWMIFETSTLGLVSKYLENLQKGLRPKTLIMRQFGFDRASGKVFLSWIHQLTYVRNICAHHARLFSRKLTYSSTVPKKLAYEWVNEIPASDKVYMAICVLTYLLNICAPDYQFKDKLIYLLDNANNEQLNFMGCPQDWKEQALFMIPL